MNNNRVACGRPTSWSCGAMTSQTPSLAMSSATSCGPTSRTSTGGSSETPTACTEASPRLRDKLRPPRSPRLVTRWQPPSTSTWPPERKMRSRSLGTPGRWSRVSCSATSRCCPALRLNLEHVSSGSPWSSSRHRHERRHGYRRHRHRHRPHHHHRLDRVVIIIIVNVVIVTIDIINTLVIVDIVANVVFVAYVIIFVSGTLVIVIVVIVVFVILVTPSRSSASSSSSSRSFGLGIISAAGRAFAKAHATPAVPRLFFGPACVAKQLSECRPTAPGADLRFKFDQTLASWALLWPMLATVGRTLTLEGRPRNPTQPVQVARSKLEAEIARYFARCWPDQPETLTIVNITIGNMNHRSDPSRKRPFWCELRTAPAGDQGPTALQLAPFRPTLRRFLSAADFGPPPSADLCYTHLSVASFGPLLQALNN